VAIYSTLREDLYLVYAGRDPDSNLPVIHGYVNPLVKWIWLGGIVMVLGTVLALVPNRQPVLASQTVQHPADTALEAGVAVASNAYRESGAND